MAQLSAEQIRDQFGFSYNEKHAKNGGGYDSEHGGRSDGAIYNINTGEYIGTIDNFSPKDDSGYAKGIGKFESVQDYGIEHGLTNKRKKWNSMNDVSGAVNDILMQSEPEPEAPPKTLDDYTDRAKDEDHLAAEDAYKDNYKNGNPWAATSAVDSYKSAFDRATAAGKDMTANDYLMQRADDKKGGVNRFIGYLGDKNTLANEEQNYAFENFMDKAEHLDFKGPPTLNDPSEAYDKYKNDIDSI